MARRQISRRAFLSTTMAAGAAAMLAPGARVLGANGDIRMAVIGCGGMGGGHIGELAGMQGVRLVAVSDADTARMDEKTAKLEQQPAKHQDFRKLLERDDVDAVVIATPNHWHAPMAIAACEAGKDVYVQKPVSHCIWEGRKMVEAARKHNRIVQAGTQQRSDPYYEELKADLHGGEYGPIKMVHCLKHQVRQPIGMVTEPQPIPETVDYDLWCGPAAKTELMRERLHYDWHWQWNCGDGEMGNWGPHIIDDLRNIMNWDSVPDRVIGAGERYWEDNGNTPNMHIALFEYDGFPVVVDVRNLPASKDEPNKASSYMNSSGHNVIVCEDATVYSTRGGGKAVDGEGKVIREYKGDSGRGHMENFLKALRERDASILNSEVEVGHKSTLMCHQANIAFRTGSQASVEEIKDAMGPDEDALNTIEDVAAQLKANGIDVSAQPLHLGPQLVFDPQSEQFTGENADKANAYLRYDMREPYAIG